MDKREYVHKRKGRYMAQFLDYFEEQIEPLISKEISDDVKAMARRKFGALASDVCEVIELKDDAMNGYARELKDKIHPDSSAPASSREGVAS